MYTSYGGDLARQRMDQRMRDAEVYRLAAKGRRHGLGAAAVRRGAAALLGLLDSPLRR